MRELYYDERGNNIEAYGWKSNGVQDWHSVSTYFEGTNQIAEQIYEGADFCNIDTYGMNGNLLSTVHKNSEGITEYSARF